MPPLYLKELLIAYAPTRDDVMDWARQASRLETEKHKKEPAEKSVQITFHADRRLDYDQQKIDSLKKTNIYLLCT